MLNICQYNYKNNARFPKINFHYQRHYDYQYKMQYVFNSLSTVCSRQAITQYVCEHLL